MIRRRSLITVAVLVLAWTLVQAQDMGFRGQLSTWASWIDEGSKAQVGGRYIGELSLADDLSPTWQLNGEAAFDAHGSGLIDDLNDMEGNGDIDPYRLWLRLATPQFEARAGLQKISFGSASLLRPLMWFDTLDPRDPLQLTDGVYGLLGRYTFLNNANIWLWGLYGNDDLRGWETIPTDEDEIEWGGRMQVPLGTGELGLSYHHRQADPSRAVFGAVNPEQGVFPEDRLGLDGKWDVLVGLWFEGTVMRQELESPESRYRRQLTVGSDYTFDVGNGYHLLGEHFISEVAEKAMGDGDSRSISALSCNYPWSLFDTVTAFVYYDWEGDTWSPFLEWRRTYDQWRIHVSAFRTEDESRPERGANESGLVGNGVRVMLVFNH